MEVTICLSVGVKPVSLEIGINSMSRGFFKAFFPCRLHLKLLYDTTIFRDEITYPDPI